MKLLNFISFHLPDSIYCASLHYRVPHYLNLYYLSPPYQEKSCRETSAGPNYVQSFIVVRAARITRIMQQLISL